MNAIKNNLKAVSTSLVLVCLFMSSMMMAQTETIEKAATNDVLGVLSFENETIDYGTIQQNADGVRIFKFTNTGEAPIVISKVKSSCGCTVPTYPKTAILPGETSEISVKYATNRIGAFKKTITITSNASEANKILRIKGNVLKSDS
ncbi:DUF1573 domain-containing protein [Subsaximicrobium wynnwilliamsii]|nr:DUF1573 domain-containing protein [Subsaximicrobium wynnwilliamsii]